MNSSESADALRRRIKDLKHSRRLCHEIAGCALGVCELDGDCCPLQPTKYRVYADGDVVHEDDFGECDRSTPYYDDYGAYDVTSATDRDTLPPELADYLTENDT